MKNYVLSAFTLPAFVTALMAGSAAAQMRAAATIEIHALPDGGDTAQRLW